MLASRVLLHLPFMPSTGRSTPDHDVCPGRYAVDVLDVPPPLFLQGDICRRYFLCAGWSFWDWKWIHVLQSEYRCSWNHKGEHLFFVCF